MSPFPPEKLHFCKNFPTIPSTLHLSLFLGYILEMIYPYVVIINVGLAKMSFQIKALSQQKLLTRNMQSPSPWHVKSYRERFFSEPEKSTL